MTDKRVLTLQDISCMGQCSITVALPIISACGVETIILPSAVLSTHTGGFKDFSFRDLTEDIPTIMNHWINEGIKFDCLYTGYLGNIEQIDYVKDIKKSLLTKDAMVIVDPAMADLGKLYKGFDDDFVKHMAKLCSEADIILPNITEIAFMTGNDVVLENHTEDYILKLLNDMADFGPKKIILKGIRYKSDEIGIAIFDCHDKTIQYYFTERIDKSSHGTGDCYAAAFTGALMQGKSEYEASSIAADFVVKCIKATLDDPTHWYGVKFEKALPQLVSIVNS